MFPLPKIKKTNRLKNKRDQQVDRNKIPSISTKQITNYKAAVKPIWSYGIELWSCASISNIVIMQRSKSTILRAIAITPRDVTSHTLHTDFNISYVNDVIHERINKYHKKLEAHRNPVLQPLLQPINSRRL